MITATLFSAALMLQSGPICAGSMTAAQVFQDRSEKFEQEAEPRVSLKAFPSAVDIRVQQAADDIVSHVGVKSNFTVAPAEVANAVAYIGGGGSRLLLYNEAFMTNVHHRVCPDWGVTGIMAHEIGHHLQGHVFKKVDVDYHQLELEADEFVGFVMYRMGATLEEAQRLTARLVQDTETATHPGKARRLGAIEAGWMRARGIAADEYFSDEQRRQRADAQPDNRETGD